MNETLSIFIFIWCGAVVVFVVAHIRKFPEIVMPGIFGMTYSTIIYCLAEIGARQFGIYYLFMVMGFLQPIASLVFAAIGWSFLKKMIKE